MVPTDSDGDTTGDGESNGASGDTDRSSEKAALRRESSASGSGSRLESDRSNTTDNDYVNDLVNELGRVHGGESSAVVGVRSARIAAHLNTLTLEEHRERRLRFGRELVSELGGDPERYDDFAKSDLARMLLGVAYRSVMPEEYETVTDAEKKYEKVAKDIRKEG